MDNEKRIRDRAHQIWEAEGRPEGRAAQHWAQAQAEADDDGTLGRTEAPSQAQEPDLTERSAEAALPDSGRADGRIIEAGEGGTAGGPDEADEAVAASRDLNTDTPR